jgi:signal transduction histidine kinase
LTPLLEPLKEWQERNEQYMQELAEQYEEANEQLAISELHLANNKKRNLEQRAKVSVINSITPFIDRMIHEINRLEQNQEDENTRQERYTYISELTKQINDYNDVLTEWIQMRQGELSLQIESFPLQSLFDIVKRGRMSFQLKGVTLEVTDTDTIVKADRILTLFMLNTLADNARKFTSDGGKVTIQATATDNYVEVSIIDSGVGMSESQLEHLFDHKPLLNTTESGNAQQKPLSHGFGLMNC